MKATFLFLLLFGSLLVSAQKVDFQQKVDYTIEVTLDDQLHLLNGSERLIYTNNSPDTLHEIFWHLWPNAYSDKNTAFGEQQLRNGNTNFYFTEEENRGGFKKLNCKLDGQALELDQWEGHKDVATTVLPRPIAPGASMEFEFEFSIKIPKSFSRMGRTDSSYQLTQWYPKPAVYDKDGWHPMPYLDQGEFYSEFGSFDVSISLPANYVVAATGVLATEEERSWLVALSQDTFTGSETDENDALRKRKGTKTIRYTAEKVHDFAWFTDMKFHVRHKTVAMDGRDSLDIWAFFTDREAFIWEKATDYLERSVRFYSDHVGTYPYPQVTAVEGALSAGAGMEYPMITIIGYSGEPESLDEVITHEVGHNWWYGILASNERDHPWIDEGINSFYEHLYMKQYYPGENSEYEDILSYDGVDGWWIWDAQSFDKDDQAPNTPSEEFSDLNYYLSAYWKPAQAFLHLYELYPPEQFKSCMNAFYDKYAFRHFGPAEIKEHFESHYEESLDWLFDDLINSNATADIALSNVKKDGDRIRFKVKNKGSIDAPFQIGLFVDNKKQILTKRADLSEGNEFEFTLPENTNALMLNPGKTIPEDRLGNNIQRLKNGRLQGKPLKIGFLTGLVSPFEYKIFATPSLGYNLYDGFQMGVWLHNVGIPDRAFQFSVAPFYGTSSNRLNGILNLRHQWRLDDGLFKKITLGVDAKRFSYSYNEVYDYKDHYLKFAPYLRFDLDQSATSYWSHAIDLRSTWIQQEYARGISVEEGVFEEEQDVYWIHQLSFNTNYAHPITPFSGKLTLEQSVAGQRIGLELNQAWQYQKGKFLRGRAFVGGLFLSGNARFNNQLLANGTTGIGQRDYLYDEILLGRSESEGFWSQQIFTRDGSLKTRANNLISNEFLTSVGVEWDLPLPVPFFLYADLAVYDDISLTENGLSTAFSSGIAFSILEKTLEVYFPIYENETITNSLTYRNAPGYFQRVTFQLNINQWGTFKVKERLGLY